MSPTPFDTCSPRCSASDLPSFSGPPACARCDVPGVPLYDAPGGPCCALCAEAIDVDAHRPTDRVSPIQFGRGGDERLAGSWCMRQLRARLGLDSPRLIRTIQKHAQGAA